jgi:hypothetical protein
MSIDCVHIIHLSPRRDRLALLEKRVIDSTNDQLQNMGGIFRSGTSLSGHFTCTQKDHFLGKTK